jgi:protein-S-isoprenylcysteine O-methyltransferase Ste14
MTRALIAIGAVLLSFLVWGLLSGRWSADASAARSSARSQRTDATHPLLAIPVPWVFMLAYLLGVVAHLLLPWRITSPATTRLIWWIGLVPLGLGMSLAFTALGIFKRSRTTTVPFETPTRLVLSGPYRFTRNPMYVGLSLIYVGVAATQALLWPLVFLPLVVVYVDRVVIPVEERRLHEVFGADYDQFRARVRRWL